MSAELFSDLIGAIVEQEILDKINRRLEELEKVYCRYQGPPGKPGKDAPPPRITIGTVTSGDQPDAKIRTVDGTFVLDLSLPRGSDGQNTLVMASRICDT